MSTKINQNKPTAYVVNGKNLSFERPLVMGIVNLTPDSFYDGGKYSGLNDVLRDAEEKIKQGAAIIDLGAVSTRPRAVDISAEEEWSRLEGPLTELRKAFPDLFISVDTYRSAIAKRAAQLGADIINDISGGNFDAAMFETVAKLDVAYVLMHIQGTPQTMQVDPHYGDVVYEIREELAAKAERLRQSGFKNIILDVGFGFGKTVEHNFQLLKHLPQFGELGYPLLAGLSRKSMVNKVIKTNPVTSLNGTTVLNTIALLNGASILRVHDVAEARQAIALTEYYRSV